MLKKVNGSQPGDPGKAAETIIEITETERAPLRLVLGKYAHGKAGRKIKTTRQELDTWRDIRLSTDFS